MKKSIIFVLSLLLLVLLSSCGCEHEFDSGKITQHATCTEEGTKTYTCSLCGKTKVESIGLIDHKYNSEITKEATFTETGVKTYTCSVCGDKYTEEIPVKIEKATVIITKKTNQNKDTYNWIFNDGVYFNFKIKNLTDKTLKGVEGMLHIYDMFDNELKSLQCDFTGKNIPPNKSVTFKNYGFEVNEFINDDVKVFDASFDDLKFEFDVTSIVYKDGKKETF